MSKNSLSRREVCSLLAAPAALGLLAARSAGGESKGRGKVLMPVGDATEVMDTLYPFFRLGEEGFEVVVAGPEARLYHGVMHEIPPDQNIPWDITREQPAYHIKAAVAFRDVRPEEYADLFLSGGQTPEYLRYNPDLMRIARHFLGNLISARGWQDYRTDFMRQFIGKRQRSKALARRPDRR